MGDENPIHTLGDYSKPSHEGYMNTIELPVGNKVVPLRSDTIRLVQNGCSFHGLRSEDLDQHLKDFLKLMDSLDLHVKAIALPQDVPSTSDRHLIELKNQVQRLMEAHLDLRNHLLKIGINFMASKDADCPRSTMLNPYPWFNKHYHNTSQAKNDSRDGMAEEEDQERKGDPEDTNTITCIGERRVRQLAGAGRMDITDVCEDDYDRGCRKPSDLEDGFYKDTIKLGPEYLTGMDDEGEVTKFLIKNEEEIFTDAGDGVRIYPDGVASLAMLYLMRRSLKVLRKFHWMILGGRFNQLSHVSSPLLSKPGEY
ncbi:hypothetical protein Tco_0355218 [Tanacetum coccineum]